MYMCVCDLNPNFLKGKNLDINLKGIKLHAIKLADMLRRCSLQ